MAAGAPDLRSTGTNALDCARNSPSNPVVAVILLDSYLVFEIILLLNMLIAMMGSTYDRVREQQATNFMYAQQ